MAVISYRRRKRFSYFAGFLFVSEFSDCQHNMGFVLSLHFHKNLGQAS